MLAEARMITLTIDTFHRSGEAWCIPIVLMTLFATFAATLFSLAVLRSVAEALTFEATSRLAHFDKLFS